MAGTPQALAAALLLLAGAQAHAQATQTPYRCLSGGRVTYSGTPCPGGREVGAAPARVTDKWRAPPQDRATIARRAQLSDEGRQECRELDAQRAEQEALLKARGASATLQEEMPLVHMKRRARELRC
jgi:hypothetical protein